MNRANRSLLVQLVWSNWEEHYGATNMNHKILAEVVSLHINPQLSHLPPFSSPQAKLVCNRHKQLCHIVKKRIWVQIQMIKFCFANFFWLEGKCFQPSYTEAVFLNRNLRTYIYNEVTGIEQISHHVPTEVYVVQTFATMRKIYFELKPNSATWSIPPM